MSQITLSGYHCTFSLVNLTFLGLCLVIGMSDIYCVARTDHPVGSDRLQVVSGGALEAVVRQDAGQDH